MTACGDDDDDGGGGEKVVSGEAGGTVNVYSSLPLQGASRPQTTAMVDGIKLALEQAGGKAGETTVKYTSLDDSNRAGGQLDAGGRGATRGRSPAMTRPLPTSVSSTGRKRSLDPILNEVPVAQISPANTAVGLTSDEPGADKGEPDKCYPTGERHYLRIVPKDTIQGAALATVMKKDGCTNTYILNDKEVYGQVCRGTSRALRRRRVSRCRAMRASTRRPRTSAHRHRRSLMRAPTAPCSPDHRQRRGPAVQGRCRCGAGRQALRA